MTTAVGFTCGPFVAVSLDVGALASACVHEPDCPLREQWPNKYVSASLSLTVLPVKAGVIIPTWEAWPET